MLFQFVMQLDLQKKWTQMGAAREYTYVHWYMPYEFKEYYLKLIDLKLVFFCVIFGMVLGLIAFFFEIFQGN